MKGGWRQKADFKFTHGLICRYCSYGMCTFRIPIHVLWSDLCSLIMYVRKIRVKKNMCEEVTVYLEVKIPALPLTSCMTLDKLFNIFKCSFTCNIRININLCHGVFLRTKFNECMREEFSSPWKFSINSGYSDYRQVAIYI